MKTRIVWMLGGLAVFLAACATDQSKSSVAPGTVTAQMRSGSNELRTYQILDWIAPDDRTLLVSSMDRSLFRAGFKHPCTGLRLVDTIAFIVPTPPQVEKLEGVVLPDGKRCELDSITRLEMAPSRGKDGAASENP
jgi:Family of unknown function (DUF6491)